MRLIPGSDPRVGVPVEPERHLRSAHEDGAPDQVRVLHHEIDRSGLRFRQRPLLKDRTARAHELEKPFLVDVFLEELARRGRLVDVDLLDVDLLCVQDTPGVLARGSGGLRVEDGLGHPCIVE